MKISLKVQDDEQNPQLHHPHGNRDDRSKNPLLLRAKVPVTVFGLPLLSGVAATDPSDLSFSLRTNFLSGPSLKLSYTPTSSSATAGDAPLTLTLKSGVSLFGSPRNSPLVISAHFALSHHTPNPTPTFSLQIKPQFGYFSLMKTIYSSQNPNPKANGEATSMGFVALERPMAWKDSTTDSSDKVSVLSGVAVAARTALPLPKHLAVNFRWGVNIPSDVGKQLPFLTIHKIGIERDDRTEEVKEAETKSSEGEAKSSEGKANDLELLKGMCLSVRREVELLQSENREMKQILGKRFGNLRGQEWTYQRHGNGAAKKPSPEPTAAAATQSGGEFEQRKTKKNGGQENVRKESKKDMNGVSDLESELQRAIKAAYS